MESFEKTNGKVEAHLYKLYDVTISFLIFCSATTTTLEKVLSIGTGLQHRSSMWPAMYKRRLNEKPAFCNVFS